MRKYKTVSGNLYYAIKLLDNTSIDVGSGKAMYGVTGDFLVIPSIPTEGHQLYIVDSGLFHHLFSPVEELRTDEIKTKIKPKIAIKEKNVIDDILSKIDEKKILDSEKEFDVESLIVRDGDGLPAHPYMNIVDED